MAKKLSEVTTTTASTGGYLHIIKPSGGGFESHKISVDDLIGTAQTTNVIFRNQFAPFLFNFIGATFTPTIYTKKITGSPSLKIGTTLGGDDLLPLTPLDDFNRIDLNYYNSANYTIYFTPSGGSLDLRIDKINSIL
jgi:hypothetical protein